MTFPVSQHQGRAFSSAPTGHSARKSLSLSVQLSLQGSWGTSGCPCQTLLTHLTTHSLPSRAVQATNLNNTTWGPTTSGGHENADKASSGHPPSPGQGRRAKQQAWASASCARHGPMSSPGRHRASAVTPLQARHRRAPARNGPSAALWSLWPFSNSSS